MERRNLLSDRDNQKQIEKSSPDALPSNRLQELRKSHLIRNPHRWGDQQICTECKEVSALSNAWDKGKYKLSPEEDRLLNEWLKSLPIGENGQRAPKVELSTTFTPDNLILVGGMPRGDRASTSGHVSSEDLARMSADEQIMWCVDGGLAKALGPDGDSDAFAPVILGMLNNGQINGYTKTGIFNAMGTILAEHYDEGMVKEIMQKARNGNDYAQSAMGTIIAKHYDEGMVKEIMQKARDDNERPFSDKRAQKAMDTILAEHYNEGMVKEIMQMARDGNGWGAQEAMGTILAKHYNEGMVQEIIQMARYTHYTNEGA